MADHSDTEKTGTVARKEDKGLPSEEQNPRGLGAIRCHLQDICESARHGDLAAAVRPWDFASLVAVVAFLLDSES